MENSEDDLELIFEEDGSIKKEQLGKNKKLKVFGDLIIDSRVSVFYSVHYIIGKLFLKQY